MKQSRLILNFLTLILPLEAFAEVVSDDDLATPLTAIRDTLKVIKPRENIELLDVDTFAEMFTQGRISGQLRSAYIGDDHTIDIDNKHYATAVGGDIRYELGRLDGFNASIALYNTQDVPSLSGNGMAHNDELASASGTYTQVGEAYLNYKNDGLNIRAGRQTLNTPLADNDDIRIVQNSFEAYMAAYVRGDYTYTAGNIQSWQGFDAGLDKKWQKTGEQGTWLGGITCDSDTFDYNLWYYDITEMLQAGYADSSIYYDFYDDITLHLSVQYLHEAQLASSGYSADIYGGMIDFSLYGLGVTLAGNEGVAGNCKQSFSGFGGGTLYTSMDSTILDIVTADRNSQALTSALTYTTLFDLSFTYIYGEFTGKENTQHQKADIVEQNFELQYNFNDAFLVAMIYVICKDKIDPNNEETNFNRAQVTLSYNF